MQRQTRLCVSLGHRDQSAGRLASLVDAGVDAFVLRLQTGDERWWQEVMASVREVEQSSQRPLAVILDLPESLTDQERFMRTIRAEDLAGIDYLAVSTPRGGGEFERLRESLHARAIRLHLIAKFGHAENFEDIDGIVRSSDGVMITEAGLLALEPSAAPIAQKSISRQCQLAAKPCIVARHALRSGVTSGSTELAEVFDLANLVFDHADAVALTDDPFNSDYLVEMVGAADRILIAAEVYLGITDRPVRVGFGQPPNTAALAYAIRHILKMQEIAAVAVYSITGATARVISKNWIDCPILALSPREETSRIMCLYHGVISRHVEEQLDAARLLHTAGVLAKELGIADAGERIIVVSGHPNQTQDQANGFVVETVS